MNGARCVMRGGSQEPYHGTLMVSSGQSFGGLLVRTYLSACWSTSNLATGDDNVVEPENGNYWLADQISLTIMTLTRNIQASLTGSRGQLA